MNADFKSPDLVINKVSCVESHLDESEKNNYRYETRYVELPDSRLYSQQEFDRLYNIWKDFKGKARYFLYDVKDATYSISTHSITDENNNKIIDQVENKTVGSLSYTCDITIENKGDDITDSASVFYELYIKHNNNYYLGMEFQTLDGFINIPELKNMETFTTKKTITFQPNYLKGFKVTDFDLDFDSKRKWGTDVNIPLNEKIDFKLLLNANPQPPMFPNYMNQTLGRTIYKNQSEELQHKNKFPESNYSNNQFDFTISLPELLYPNQTPEINVEIDEENKKAYLTWDKVSNADRYELNISYSYDNKLDITADKEKLISLDVNTNEYEFDYSNLTYKDYVNFWLKTSNQYGDTHSTYENFRTPIDPFTDISKDAWYYDSLIKAYRRGKISGYPDSIDAKGNQTFVFKADQSVTKAEAIKIVSIGDYANYSQDSVPARYKNKWHSGMLGYLIDNNFSIIQDGLDLDQQITRSELVTFIMQNRYFLNQDTRNVFENNPEVNNFFNYKFADVLESPQKKYVQFAYDMQIINGNANGLFKPNDSLNRAEAVQIMHNISGSKFRG
ncbi:MAG: S-layer homology domain-containing protein [Crocinitomicaceae bacterium]